jgi:hypothetical protein
MYVAVIVCGWFEVLSFLLLSWFMTMVVRAKHDCFLLDLFDTCK